MSGFVTDKAIFRVFIKSRRALEKDDIWWGRNQFLREKMSSGCCRLYSEGVGFPDPSTRGASSEGSFDLWKPADRFTNIKFTFKGSLEGVVRGVGFVSCVYIITEDLPLKDTKGWVKCYA